MKKIKRFFSLFLAGTLLLSIGIQSKSVQAESTSEIAKLEIRVNGNGKVIVNDGYSKYNLENNDVLTANITVNSDLQLTVTPEEGYYLASVSGIDSQVGGDESSKIYNVTTGANGTFINVNFEKIKDETKDETKDENTSTEIIEKEEVIVEENNNEIDNIISRYLEGIYNDEDILEFRKNLVNKYNLEKYVDDDFFFKEKYLSDLQELDTIGECISLVKISKKDLALEYFPENYDLYSTIVEETSDNFFKALWNKLFDTKTDLTVTNHGNLTYYESGILMGRGDMFSINGRIAFCADHSKTSPSTGVRILSTSLESNSNIRKILYYGFSGPAQITGWDSNGLRIATAMAISQVRNGDGKTLGNRLLNQVSSMAEPPSSFKAYIASTEGSSYQDLAFWELEQQGSLQISKASSDPSITNGNNYYNISGAEYGVYTGSNATGQIATLTIGSNGWSQEISLDAGTYYIKEIKAPKGFALDSSIYPITVTASNKTTKSFTDKPQTDPISIVLQKVDADTGNASPQGNGTLQDAQFTVKFYAGEYSEGVNPADLGVRPTRTWILKTDSNGRSRLNDSYKVSGDSFWYNSQGIPTLPLGTLTIQETKAPVGYKINSEVFVRRITPNGTAEGVSTYNEPIIKEDSLNFTIKKVQSGTNIVIPNAKFRHTNPDGSVEELQTGSKGEVVIRGLTQGIHTIVETSAPDGYEVNTNEFKFEVQTDNTIRLTTNTTNLGMSYSVSDGDGILTVSDEVKPYSLRLTKINDKGAVLEGAEFTLYSDSDCNNAIETQVSDVNGNLKFNNLRPGTSYYMKETKAPQGYKIPVDIFGNVHIYEIYVESTPVNNVFDYYIDGKKYTVNDTSSNNDVYLSGTKENREINIKIINTIGMKLPKTGSWMMIPLLLLGLGLMSYSLISDKKKKDDKQ